MMASLTSPLLPFSALPLASTTTTALGILPAEIWIVILETAIDVHPAKKEICTRLARTCRTLNRIVTPYLWDSVVLSRPSVYSFVHPPPPAKVAGLVHVASACARTLKKHDDIANCVKTFTLRGWFVKGSVESSPDFPALEAINHAFDHVISALLRCRNLTTLHLQNVQIPPKLHRALYHLPALRVLTLECCNISCRGETCAWNPQRLPIRSLKLVQTSLSVHGYQHRVNSVEALAEAAQLTELEVDAAIFDHVMNLYITSGMPTTLRKLRASPPLATEVSGALLTDFLAMKGNTLQSLSVLRGFEGFVPERVLPDALGSLTEVAGPIELVLALAQGRAVGKVKFIDRLRKDGPVLRATLERLASATTAPITSLSIKVEEMDVECFIDIARVAPNLRELVLEYHTVDPGMRLTLPQSLKNILQLSLPHLRTLILVIVDPTSSLNQTTPESAPSSFNRESDPPAVTHTEIQSPLAEKALVEMCGSACPDLMDVAFVRSWSWVRRQSGVADWLKVPTPVRTCWAF